MKRQEFNKKRHEIEKQKQLHDLLMNEDNTISIEEALSNAKNKKDICD